MILKHLFLQNFRNYSKIEFTFSPDTTLVVGPNTAGKSNMMEAIYLLATGKSFRAEKDSQMIQFGKEIARVKGILGNGAEEPPLRQGFAGQADGTNDQRLETKDDTTLEFVLAQEQDGSLLKRYLVNSIPRRRVDFASNLKALIFTPEDLDIIVDGPSLRRRFLDEVLEQTDLQYRRALIVYTKAIRQRNALLETARETGMRQEKQFAYWDQLLIQNGGIMTNKRQELLNYINVKEKAVADVTVIYDKSIISEERLLQYRDAEVGVGVTLVGPHRDDFNVKMGEKGQKGEQDIKIFGSRGQQRLAILQLKLLQLLYMEEMLSERPLLLLDDIFSELDTGHIQLVLSMIHKQQTIVTTTHKEFVENNLFKDMVMIELGK